jgi:hypothetical protein
MQRLAKNSIVSIFLVSAFLLSTGISLGFIPSELPSACCEKETQKEHSDTTTCPDTGCLCISCISLAPVHSYHNDNTPFLASTGDNRRQPCCVSGYSRSIERPPENC